MAQMMDIQFKVEGTLNDLHFLLLFFKEEQQCQIQTVKSKEKENPTRRSH